MAYLLWLLLVVCVLQNTSSWRHYDAIASVCAPSPPMIRNTRIEAMRQKDKVVVETMPTALCYSADKSRPRGCDLIDQSKEKEKAARKLANNIIALPLPCVTSSNCPYDRFQCSKGHIWSAVPGSPVCYQCPDCLSNSYERVALRVNRKLADRVVEVINAKNGTCLNAEVLLTGRVVYKTKLQISCNYGHIWDTEVDRLLCRKTWCRECAIHDRVLGEESFHETAKYFKGTFLGLVDELDGHYITSLANWKCTKGHTFTQTLQNIRRRPNGKRKCSWCPTCRRDYKMNFIWDPKPNDRMNSK